MSNPEQTAGEERGDSNSGFNEHLKENKVAGEMFKAIGPLCIFWMLFLELGEFKLYVVVLNVCKEAYWGICIVVTQKLMCWCH